MTKQDAREIISNQFKNPPDHVRTEIEKYDMTKIKELFGYDFIELTCIEQANINIARRNILKEII